MVHGRRGAARCGVASHFVALDALVGVGAGVVEIGGIGPKLEDRMKVGLAEEPTRAARFADYIRVE